MGHVSGYGSAMSIYDWNNHAADALAYTLAGVQKRKGATYVATVPGPFGKVVSLEVKGGRVLARCEGGVMIVPVRARAVEPID
jgi:hypothetical protein